MGLSGTQIVRFAFAIAIAAVGIFASAQGLVTESLAKSGQAILSFAPNRTPTGQTERASRAVAAGDYGSAITPARLSLAQRPLDAATLRLLAVSQLNTDNAEGAGRSLTLASQLGWRDTATQLLLFQIARESGDVNGAAIRFDSMARQKMEAGRLKELMHTFLLDPGAPEALAERISGNPKWRREYLLTTDPIPAETYPAWLEMLAAMKRIGSPPRPNEYTAIERTLVDAGQIPLAIEASRTFGALSKGEADGFETLSQGELASPFGWSVFPGREAAVTEPERGMVRVTADGQVGGPIIQRVAPLGAGTHSLLVRSDGQEPDGEAAFRWTVTCLPSRVELETRINSTRSAAGEPSTEQVSFVAPPGCLAARVALTSLAGMIRGDYALTVSRARLD